MPSTSQAQYKYIQYLRNKYGSKEKAPEKYKFAFDKEWTKNVDYKSLPKKAEKDIAESFLKSKYNHFSDFLNEEMTSADIPQSSRPETVRKVVKIGSIAKVDEDNIEEVAGKAGANDFFTETDDEIVEDFLRSKKDKKVVLDIDKKVDNKNKKVLKAEK